MLCRDATSFKSSFSMELFRKQGVSWERGWRNETAPLQRQSSLNEEWIVPGLTTSCGAGVHESLSALICFFICQNLGSNTGPCHGVPKPRARTSPGLNTCASPQAPDLAPTRSNASWQQTCKRTPCILCGQNLMTARVQLSGAADVGIGYGFSLPSSVETTISIGKSINYYFLFFFFSWTNFWESKSTPLGQYVWRL